MVTPHPRPLSHDGRGGRIPSPGGEGQGEGLYGYGLIPISSTIHQYTISLTFPAEKGDCLAYSPDR